MDRFYIYKGDLIGLPVTENYIVYRWSENDCKVLFSVTEQGDSLNCHLASDKRGLRKLKQAIEEFYNFLLSRYKWCKMIIAKVKKASVERVLIKCGFKKLFDADNVKLYARCRSWAI